jgi:hypothetical protein
MSTQNNVYDQWIEEELLEELKSKWEVIPFGSKLVCDPPPENCDEDWAVIFPFKHETKMVNGLGGVEIPLNMFPTKYYKEHLEKVHKILDKAGYKLCNEDYKQVPQHFNTYRKEKVNISIYGDLKYGHKLKVATDICKRMNIQDKKERVEIFQIIVGEKNPKVEKDFSRLVYVKTLQELESQDI